MSFLLVALLSFSAQASWWTNFCEKHLIDDDPYQFETYSVHHLVTAWFDTKALGVLPNKALKNEIQKRLDDPTSTSMDKEILSKLTGLKPGGLK